MPDIITSTTQQFLDIHDITNNFVIMKDGTASVVLTVNAMNFGLLAEEEQDAVMYAYAGLLNSLNYPVQIIINSTTKDVTTYLQLLQDQEEVTTSDVMKNRIRIYREFVANLIQERNVLDKKFYVAIPANAVELGLMGASTVLPGRTKFDISSVERSLLLEKAQNLLEPKRDHLIAQFARIGLFSRQLNTQEIIQLFYIRYNPEAAEGQQIAESNSYTSPLVQASVQGSVMNTTNPQDPMAPTQPGGVEQMSPQPPTSPTPEGQGQIVPPVPEMPTADTSVSQPTPQPAPEATPAAEMTPPAAPTPVVEPMPAAPSAPGATTPETPSFTTIPTNPMPAAPSETPTPPMSPEAPSSAAATMPAMPQTPEPSPMGMTQPAPTEAAMPNNGITPPETPAFSPTVPATPTVAASQPESMITPPSTTATEATTKSPDVPTPAEVQADIDTAAAELASNPPPAPPAQPGAEASVNQPEPPKDNQDGIPTL